MAARHSWAALLVFTLSLSLGSPWSAGQEECDAVVSICGVTLEVPSPLYPTIGDALDAAMDGDCIEVEGGFAYSENIVIDVSVHLIGTPILPCTVEDTFDCAIDVTDCFPVINGDPSAPVVTILAEDVVIEGFVIRDGSNGIFCDGTSPVIKNCYVHENASTGIVVLDGSPEIHCSCIRDNSGSIVAAGGLVIMEDSLTTAQPELSITTSTFIANDGDFAGGAVTSDVCTEVTFDACRFDSNTADIGGAIFTQGARLVVRGSTFNANEAPDFVGGAIAVVGDPSAACAMTEVTLEDCKFSANLGNYGSAVYAEAPAGATIALRRNLFYDQDSTALIASVGGAVCFGAGSATVDIANCTFADNYAEEGDVIAVGSSTSPGLACDMSVVLKDSIAWDTAATPTYDAFEAGLTTDLGTLTLTYSDVWNCDADPLCDGLTGNIDEDPLFELPATGDFRLLYDCSVDPAIASPCVDAADPASPLDPDDTRADMGAIAAWTARYFKRGDFDGTGTPALLDAVAALTYLFNSGASPPTLDAVDFDDNGAVALLDAILLLTYLFQNGAPPPAPGPDTCGPDPTPDSLPEFCAGDGNACNPVP